MRRNLRGGFTLIEILVVLVIMGFLVAMVAPKLSGIVDSAVDTACDTNQERLRTVVNSFVTQNNSLPSGLTNMIKYQNDTTSSANVAILDGDNNDKNDGKEFLSSELVERMHPKVHFLNADEAEELIGLGVKGVFNHAKVVPANFADVNGTAEEDKIEEMNVRANVAAGLPVFMIGVGADDTDTLQWAEGNTVTVSGSNVVETDTEIAINAGTLTPAGAMGDATLARFDEAQSIGRIVLGVSNQGELIQDGMLEESGTCPGQIQRADHHTWGNYLIVLPRLAATMDRITADGSGSEKRLNAVALDVETGDSATDAKITGRTPATGYPHFDAEEVSMFTTSCPEGHTWGAVADAYAVAIDDAI